MVALLFLVSLEAASAETVAGCDVRDESDPPRKVLVCEGGLVIEADAAARMGLYPPRGDTPLGAVGLDAGAALVELRAGHGSFQIRTPHAIASVRGTIFAVEANAEGTSVFVERGVVAVGRRGGPEVVVLEAGEGVDVRPGQAMSVKQWGAARIRTLMRRFGR